MILIAIQIISVILALGGLIGAVFAIQGKRWVWSLIGAIVCIFAVGPYALTTILAFVSLALLAMSRYDFEDEAFRRPQYYPAYPPAPFWSPPGGPNPRHPPGGGPWPGPAAGTPPPYAPQGPPPGQEGPVYRYGELPPPRPPKY